MGIKFSVIVPVYNVEPYIEECIESIIHQSYESWELILVDDGSPDNCPAICDRYAAADSRIKVIHKENGGLTSARKVGSACSAGDYICCVDSDDWIAPNYLEVMEKAIMQYHPDMVCGNFYSVRNGTQIAQKTFVAPGVYNRDRIERDLFPILLEDNQNRYFPPSLCMKAIRREHYREEQDGVNTNITIGEDRAVVIPCVYKSKCIVMLDDCLYYYRVNTQSMTQKKKGFSWTSIEAFARHYPQRIDLSAYDFQEQYYRLITHQFFLTAKSQFNRDEPYRVIRQEILEKMNDPVFSGPIKRCHFGMSFRAKLMEYCLKLRLVWPMWLYNRILS